MIFPTSLPDPSKLKAIMQSMATLDAIFCPEWQYRYYSFDTDWGPSEQMGSIRNGSGDDLFVLFNDSGCFLKGFSHEFSQQEFTPDMFYKNVPDAFKAAVSEPAFSTQNVSFCAWHTVGHDGWENSVQDRDLDSNVFFLIQDLDGKASTYVKFLADYHEMEANLGSIQTVFDQKLMTRDLAVALNSEIDFSSLVSDLKQIGYPYEKLPEGKRTNFLRKLFDRD